MAVFAVFEKRSSLLERVSTQQELDVMWGEETDGRFLIRLVSWVDHKDAVRAACVCARRALHLVEPLEEKRPERAILAAESWCRGEVASEQVRDAHLAVVSLLASLACEDSSASFYAAISAGAAVTAAYAAAEDSMKNGVPSVVVGAVDAAASALVYAYSGYRESSEKFKDEIFRRRIMGALWVMANAIREAVPCPSLEVVLAKEESRGKQ